MNSMDFIVQMYEILREGFIVIKSLVNWEFRPMSKYLLSMIYGGEMKIGSELC